MILIFLIQQVVYLFLLTVFVPQYLGTLRVINSNPPSYLDVPNICLALLIITLSPFYTYFKHFQMLYLKLKLREFPNEEVLLKAKDDLKREMNCHIKLELGLETIYQLVLTIILLLLSYTDTPAETGLKAVFNEGLGWLPLTLLSVSILLSFNSCISAHCKAITACREHFPLKSRVMTSLYCFCGSLTRVLGIVMYFAVPLGLFSLHRHLQGEQYAFSHYTLDLVGLNGMLYLGNNPPFEWIDVDRWQKQGPLWMTYENGTYKRAGAYNDVIPNPNHLVAPPDYTFYTGLTLSVYFYIFLALIGLHMIVIFIAKFKLIHDFRFGFNLLDKLIDCLENTNIAYNTKEWDDGKGDAEEHRKRMRLNWMEGLFGISINAVFNTSLLIPLCYLGRFLVYFRHLRYVTFFFSLIKYTRCKRGMTSSAGQLVTWTRNKKLLTLVICY